MLSQSLQRAATAIKKLVFCFRVSSTIPTFFQLIRDTKRFAWSKNKPAPDENHPDTVCYSLNLQDTQRNIHLRTYAGDIQIFYEIFWRAIYALPSHILSKASTIVDIGAHAGIATLFFKLQAPEATVYALEADDENYRILLRNLEPEIKSRNVIPIHAAIADRNEMIYLRRSRLSYNTNISDSITGLVVRGIKMEQFLTEYNITSIDILKIDIEGAETFLFSDKAPWLSIVKNILIELHSDTNIKQFEKAAQLYHFRVEKRMSGDEEIYWAYKPAAEVPIA